MLDSQSKCRSFYFYLLPGFSLQAFSSAVEVLRLANEVLGQSVYSWQVISNDGEPTTASCGSLVCADLSLSFERERTRGSISAATVVIVGSRNAPSPHKQLDAWLRECRNRRGSLVGVGSGTIVLARAGLAEGRRCAVHWEQFPIFFERFRGVIATQTTFERDRDL
ncbi:AraC family transcriptional regulator [Mesorhizobium sp. ORM8.1]